MKCENILIKNNKVKITDFGISSSIASQTSRGTQCGTSGFMAPEISSGRKYNAKADIWSLGKTVVQLATGDPRGDIEPGRWSDEFFSFINCCLQDNENNRWDAKKLLKVNTYF